MQLQHPFYQCSLLLFIDKDDGDKTKVPKIANTDIIEPGTNKATITLEDGKMVLISLWKKELLFDDTNNLFQNTPTC